MSFLSIKRSLLLHYLLNIDLSKHCYPLKLVSAELGTATTKLANKSKSDLKLWEHQNKIYCV